jgi:uncharacterized protein with HEPN domain
MPRPAPKSQDAYLHDMLEAALPGVPVKSLRGMRNRIARDYGAVDFKIVWAVTQQEIAPLIRALETYFQNGAGPNQPRS